MIYALYDRRNGRRLGAAATYDEAARSARDFYPADYGRTYYRDEDGKWAWTEPLELEAIRPDIREEPGEAYPSGRPLPGEAVDRIHNSLARAIERGEIEP